MESYLQNYSCSALNIWWEYCLQICLGRNFESRAANSMTAQISIPCWLSTCCSNTQSASRRRRTPIQGVTKEPEFILLRKLGPNECYLQCVVECIAQVSYVQVTRSPWFPLTFDMNKDLWNLPRTFQSTTVHRKATLRDLPIIYHWQNSYKDKLHNKELWQIRIWVIRCNQDLHLVSAMSHRQAEGCAAHQDCSKVHQVYSRVPLWFKRTIASLWYNRFRPSIDQERWLCWNFKCPLPGDRQALVCRSWSKSGCLWKGYNFDFRSYVAKATMSIARIPRSTGNIWMQQQWQERPKLIWVHMSWRLLRMPSQHRC